MCSASGSRFKPYQLQQRGSLSLHQTRACSHRNIPRMRRKKVVYSIVKSRLFAGRVKLVWDLYRKVHIFNLSLVFPPNSSHFLIWKENNDKQNFAEKQPCLTNFFWKHVLLPFDKQSTRNNWHSYTRSPPSVYQINSFNSTPHFAFSPSKSNMTESAFCYISHQGSLKLRHVVWWGNGVAAAVIILHFEIVFSALQTFHNFLQTVMVGKKTDTSQLQDYVILLLSFCVLCHKLYIKSNFLCILSRLEEGWGIRGGGRVLTALWFFFSFFLFLPCRTATRPVLTPDTMSPTSHSLTW